MENNQSNMANVLNGGNSPILQKHNEAMAIQKDMPKSYSNRANLIKNIMSNQVYDQFSSVNETKNNSPKKIGNANNVNNINKATDVFTANSNNGVVTMKTEATSQQETQANGELNSVPKFNSESNTLLKALLKTAPKNAVVSGFQVESKPTTPDSNMTSSSNNNSSQVNDLVSLEAIQTNTLPTSNNIVNTESINLPVKLPVKQPKAPTQRKPRIPGQKKQTKMLIDLKNKILDSNSYNQMHTEISCETTTATENCNNAGTIASYSASSLTMFKQEKDLDSNLVKNFSPNQSSNDGASALQAANLKQANPRKRATKNMKASVQLHDSVVINQSNINKNDIAVNRVLNDLNSFGTLKLSQPPSNISLLSINYPERNHSLILKSATRFRGEIFNLKIENVPNFNFEHDKKAIENILSENEKYLNFLEKKVVDNNPSSLLAVATKDQSKLGNHQVGQPSKSDAFRICSLILNEPLSCSNIKNRLLIKNSSDRLNEALSSNNATNFENGNILFI